MQQKRQVNCYSLQLLSCMSCCLSVNLYMSAEFIAKNWPMPCRAAYVYMYILYQLLTAPQPSSHVLAMSEVSSRLPVSCSF